MAATEAEALCDHAVDVSLPVLLTNALVGRQPRQRALHVVAVWLPDDKDPARKLSLTTGRCFSEILLAPAQNATYRCFQ